MPTLCKPAFITTSTSCLALVSIVALTWMARYTRHSPPTSTAKKWVIWSSVLIAIQAIGMSIIVATHDDTTGINVVYGSRGLWAIVLIALVGPLLGNYERKLAKGVILYRLIGTIILTIAIVIAVMSGTS